MIDVIVLKLDVDFRHVHILRHIANRFFLRDVPEHVQCSVLSLVHINDASLNDSSEVGQQILRLFEIGSTSQIIHILNQISLLELR